MMWGSVLVSEQWRHMGEVFDHLALVALVGRQFRQALWINRQSLSLCSNRSCANLIHWRIDHWLQIEQLCSGQESWQAWWHDVVGCSGGGSL